MCQAIEEYGPIIKKLVLAWDPDFTKLTPKEKRQVEEAEQRGFIAESDID